MTSSDRQAARKRDDGEQVRRLQALALPHLDAAYNLARWLSGNSADAEDIVQEAFMRALRFFDSFEGDSARPWLLAIVRNTGYTWLEKNRPTELVAFDENAAEESGEHAAGQESNPEVVVLQIAQRRLVDQALEELPVPFREVLVLRELEDLSYKDIARIAGVPIGTVMSRLARGRAMLRRILEVRMRKAS